MSITERILPTSKMSMLLFVIFCFIIELQIFNIYYSFHLSPLKHESITESIKDKPYQRRKFISYRSSKWEQMWIDNIGVLEKDRSICQRLIKNETEYLHDFLTATCTSRFPPPYDSWCIIDDAYVPLYYNLNSNRKIPFDTTMITFVQPTEIPINVKPPPNKPVIPSSKYSHIFSQFTFLDELTGETFIEYIEPLVSHLRFPLAVCLKAACPKHIKQCNILFRGYIIPPPPPRQKSQISHYYDGGASIWDKGLGGPSLSYFTTIWERHNISFNRILAFEGNGDVDRFNRSVPPEWKNRTTFKNVFISIDPSINDERSPFLPKLIRDSTKKEDYVFFKLDIDSPTVENYIMIYLLADDNDALDYIDEIAYEHHIGGNYLMIEDVPKWAIHEKKFITIQESYQLFLKFRMKGIRSHSWI